MSFENYVGTVPNILYTEVFLWSTGVIMDKRGLLHDYTETLWSVEQEVCPLHSDIEDSVALGRASSQSLSRDKSGNCCTNKPSNMKLKCITL